MLIEIEGKLSRAIEFAKLYHQGQTRKFTGKPYVIHPFKVYKRLLKFGITDKDVLTASLLHDTLEDTQVTYNIILANFNKRVADIVRWLTNTADKAGHIDNLMKKAPYEVVAIKTFDRIDNLQDTNKRFLENYKFTTDIIKRGLERRGFTNLYKEFMKAYNRVYGGGLE